jgi:hypothetical protein
LNDLFTLFDIFQTSLYANDPDIARGGSGMGGPGESEGRSEAAES